MIKQLTIGALSLSNNLILAPMAGITDLPMRLLAREHGAALCFTEMLSAHGLVRSGAKTFDLLHSTPDDRPLGIQLFGDDPQILAEAARRVEDRGDLIDINMGCPVKKVVNSGAGSALLREPAVWVSSSTPYAVPPGCRSPSKSVPAGAPRITPFWKSPALPKKKGVTRSSSTREAAPRCLPATQTGTRSWSSRHTYEFRLSAAATSLPPGTLLTCSSRPAVMGP